MRAKILISVSLAVLIVCAFSQASYATYTANITPPWHAGISYNEGYYDVGQIWWTSYNQVTGQTDMYLKAYLNFSGNVAAGRFWKWWDEYNNSYGECYPMENLSALNINVAINVLKAWADPYAHQPFPPYAPIKPFLRFAIVVAISRPQPGPFTNYGGKAVMYTELDFWDHPSMGRTMNDMIAGGDVATYKVDNWETRSLNQWKTYSYDFLPYIDRTLKALTNSSGKQGIMMRDMLLETYVTIESITSITESQLYFKLYSATAVLFSSYSEHLNSTILKAWGATYSPLSPNWNPAADINKDNVTNILDYSAYVKHSQDEAWCNQTLNNYNP